ncbi:hypothetical protein AURDEDRAFT_176603 [Auricularia subglabra TFB-10046 SS5]|uniref:CCHC-type domain-containing protein n=1 Tax=Auricularia subglabra (strain TFB-10046 / SS5) TaxID=717982 RepID=J0LCV1_AURST|nr:hypothetical protein AURDEDRAFT_176603 [Auricularia subglabra TFB-10046 SS5]
MASIAHLLDEKLDARLGNRTTMPPLSHAPATAGGFQGTRFGTMRQGNDPMTRMGHDRCLFCDDSGHLMKQCPVRFEYLQSGKVVEDMLGRMVLPGGLHIPGPREKPMRKRVDEYWEAQARSNYYDSVMMVDNAVDIESLINTFDDDQLTPEEREYQAFLLMREQVMNYETTGRFRPSQGKRFDGIELPTRRWGPASSQNRNAPEWVPGILPAPAAVRNASASAQQAPPPKAPKKPVEMLVPIPLDEVAKKHAEMTKKAAGGRRRAGRDGGEGAAQQFQGAGGRGIAH